MDISEQIDLAERRFAEAEHRRAKAEIIAREHELHAEDIRRAALRELAEAREALAALPRHRVSTGRSVPRHLL